jgi:DNA-binding transcriptional MerR regulator
MDKCFTRKELANELKLGAETLRYYEKIGMIPLPERNKSGYRVYNEQDVMRLKFIIKGKNLGFSLREIAAIISVLKYDKKTNNKIINDRISQKIDQINERIGFLSELKAALAASQNDDVLNDCGVLNIFLR